MKNFKTISELEILNMAHNRILEMYLKECDRITENTDMEMPIAKHRAAKYKEQLDEIHGRILELEKAQ